MQECVSCVWESERKKKSPLKTKHDCVSITNILVYASAVDKHLLCLACCLLQPPLDTIDISFYANAAFGYVRTRQYFHQQSFILACLWPYGPRQNYFCTVHKLLSLRQEPLLHIQAADTHSRVMWENPEGKTTEGARCVCRCCYDCVCKREKMIKLLLCDHSHNVCEM